MINERAAENSGENQYGKIVGDA